MGDPRRIRKKYSGPSHPWEGPRIEEEKKILREYGLKNKKQIWKMDSILRDFKDQAKKLTAMTGSQSEKESQQLMIKLSSLGLLSTEAAMDDVLGLDLHSVMDRRLQSVVYRQGLARSMDQARQFVVHEHITVDGKKVTVPSYLVRVNQTVAFAEDSPMKDEMHPERIEKKPSKTKEERRKEKEQKEEEELAFSQEEILDEDEAALADLKKKKVKEKEKTAEAPAPKKTQEKAEKKEEPAKEETPEESDEGKKKGESE